MSGRVYLVGAGPGDPGLLTTRAVELIASADVVVHDRLVPREALALAGGDAELIDVGKQADGPSTPQREIERLLIEHASAGRAVVRLKGGDPFVFGRGGEEAEALRAAGVPFEVVPGVTAGVAAAAYAGVPITHRELASAVAFVTGHEHPDKAEQALDWDALAAFPGTLVFYMGVRQLAAIAERLVGAGRDAEEAAAVIERGTLPGQRVILGTLETIAAEAQSAGVMAPALTVIGPVAALRDQLRWFERRPLAGLTVAVTRARAQASGLAARLRALGAEVIEAPVIRIEPVPGPTPELDHYDLVCLTSPNGVSILFDRLTAEGRDARAFAGVRVAAIGPGTAAGLRDHGINADIVPEQFTAEGLLDALGSQPVRRALVARASEARDTLPDGLRERGAEVDVLELYRTVAEQLSGEQLAALERADYITFTSSSTVRNFLRAIDGQPRPSARLISIGPVTSRTLREHGLEPHAEAARHDIDGVIEAVLLDAGAARRA